MSTAVANQPAAALVTISSIIPGLVKIFRRNRHSQGSTETKFHGLALNVHAGLMRHLALQPLIRELVCLTVLDEDRPRLDEGKRHIVAHTFFPQAPYPLEIQGTRTVIVLAAADYLLDLPVCQIRLDTDSPDEGSAHDALVFERQISSMGMRSSARRWFSQVTLKKMFSQPSSKSDGKVSRTRSGRFVSRKNFTSGRAYMMFHALSRHASASGRKKSDVMQTRISSPLFTRYSPFLVRCKG